MKSNKCKDTISKCVGEIIEDPVIEIIKGMHCEPNRDRFYDLDSVNREQVSWGLIKKEVCSRTKISSRTFQNILNRLDKNNESEEPIYICGQPVKLDIREERVDNKRLKEKDADAKVDRRIRFCTPNSMHPVFLQLNVSQLACLMKALANYDDSGISSGLGVYIYSQLSEYAIRRIENTYARQDERLREFLDEMFDMCERGEDKLFSLFKTDVEIYEASDYRYADTLNICCKNGDHCDLELKINGQYKKYKHVKVEFADDGYKVSSDRQFFSIENIEDIKHCTR